MLEGEITERDERLAAFELVQDPAQNPDFPEAIALAQAAMLEHSPYWVPKASKSCFFCKDNDIARPKLYCSCCKKPFHITGFATVDAEGVIKCTINFPNSTPTHPHTTTCWYLAHKRLAAQAMEQAILEQQGAIEEDED